MQPLPPVALFFVLAAGVAFSLGAGAYFLGADSPALDLAAESLASCAPTLEPAGVPGALVVSAADGFPFDALEARWAREGATTPWRSLAVFLDGADGVALTDADRSGSLTAGDVFTVSGGNATGEFRCA